MHHTTKDILDQQLLLIRSQASFIENDPISIPHRFAQKEDIEIAAFLAALLAWGQRNQIILKASQLLKLMDDSPYAFAMQAAESDFASLLKFQYRTFNGFDTQSVVRALAYIYREKGGLETIFTEGFKGGDAFHAIQHFRNTILSYPHDIRSRKHIANPAKGSAAKRINMFLRWMVRDDELGIDFGLWRNISTARLICPLDLHSGRAARKLGLLQRSQNDRKAAEILTESLQAFDRVDPVKYDIALFQLSLSNAWK